MALIDVSHVQQTTALATLSLSTVISFHSVLLQLRIAEQLRNDGVMVPSLLFLFNALDYFT